MARGEIVRTHVAIEKYFCVFTGRSIKPVEIFNEKFGTSLSVNFFGGTT